MFLPAGAVPASLAFAWWGLFPLYFHLVPGIPPTQVLAHRVVWCLLFLLGVLAWRRQWAWLPGALRAPRVLGVFATSALLIGLNWLTYIWAVQANHVLDASLGYFITPLVNVLFGTVLLHERPRPAQWLALAMAAAGVFWLAWQAGRPPWIALTLALSFGAYGLIRKLAPLGALEGLTLETILLGPVALGTLALFALQGTGHFPAPTLGTNLWLLGLGPVTAIPLLLFAAGARRLRMTTLGLLQYIGPTLQFLLGVWVFHEPFDGAHLVGFVCIWMALAVYSVDSGWRLRRAGLVTRN